MRQIVSHIEKMSISEGMNQDRIVEGMNEYSDKIKEMGDRDRIIERMGDREGLVERMGDRDRIIENRQEIGGNQENELDRAIKDRFTSILNNIRRDENKLKFLAHLRSRGYSRYIWDLIPSDLNVHYQKYDDFDCVNDIMIMVYQKSVQNGKEWTYLNPLIIHRISKEDSHISLKLYHVLRTITVDTIEYLLNEGMIEISSICTNKSIEYGRLDIMEFLYNNKMFYGNPVDHLIHAAACPNIDIIQWLLEKNPRVKPDYRTLDHAVNVGNLDMIEWLNTTYSLKIKTYHIDMSSRLGHTEVTQWLKQTKMMEDRESGYFSRLLDIILESPIFCLNQSEMYDID